MKCDEDFILVTDEAWDYLFKLYGGTDIPRYSIEVSNVEPEASETIEASGTPGVKEYIVEVFYKKLQIYILPRGTSHLVLRKPSGVFITRKAKVSEYHRKVVDILLPNQKSFTAEQLLGMSRLWRLEIGEDVYDIERYQADDNSDKLFPIMGRVLNESEWIDNIDVAEDDVLLYEVQARKTKENDGYIFIPKQQAEKDKKKWVREMMNQLGVKVKDGEDAELSEEDLMRVPLDRILSTVKNGNYGRTGLQNLGNTCFMNSVL